MDREFRRHASELELIASGTPFAKSDRLYRRWLHSGRFRAHIGGRRWDRSNVRRDEKLSEFINRVTFTERTMKELIARKNSTRRLLIAQVRYSSTPNSTTETNHINKGHQDMSLTGAANANDMPLSSEKSQGAEQGQRERLPALAANDDGGEAAGQALASCRFPSPATTALGDWYGTTTTVTSTTTVTNTQSTITVNNAPRSVFTTRVNHQPNDFVKCTFTDDYTYEIPWAAAMQMVQMQALTQEYRKEISELQVQMSHLTSSMRTHLNLQNSAAYHKQKTSGTRFQCNIRRRQARKSTNKAQR